MVKQTSCLISSSILHTRAIHKPQIKTLVTKYIFYSKDGIVLCPLSLISDIATCTVDHEPQLDGVDADHVSDRFQDENKSERKDSSDRAPAPPPYPAAPYPLIDFKPFTGRSMSVGSCPPIGFEGLCDNPALSTTFPGLRSHIGDTSHYPSNYMIEPKLGMPLPDFAGLRSNKDS